MSRALTRVTVLAAIVAAGAVPASAQADFDGVWQPRYHEDQPERIPGPELRDYLGLPINDAARQFADSWDPGRIALQEEQCRVHVVALYLPRPHQPADLGGAAPQDPGPAWP